MYDIIIVGGGIAGSMAAVAACRQGAKLLVIEKNGYLGGALTDSGVGPMMTFHAGEKLVIRGITNELITRLVAKGKSPGHIVDTTGYTYSVTPFEAEAMKYELETMIIEAGGHILYHSRLADVSVKEGHIKQITICNKAGLSIYKAKCFIDASGDGDLSDWSGVACNKGREGDHKGQPMTLNIKMSHVEIEKIRSYIRAHPEEFSKSIPLLSRSRRLSIGGFKGLVEKAKKDGYLQHHVKGSILLFETDKAGEVILNCTRVIGYDGIDPISLSQAEIDGRREAQEIMAFLPKYMPGFEKAQLVTTGPSIGIRSSRQIIGHYILKAEDLMEGKSFSDTIAHSGYPIDIHNPDGSGGKSIHMPSGHYYNVPFSSLTNPVIDNLLTVGRCISATFEAQGAIRVSPTAGAIGHAGGIGAWLYVNNNEKTMKDISIMELQETIIAQGGYIDFSRLI